MSMQSNMPVDTSTSGAHANAPNMVAQLGMSPPSSQTAMVAQPQGRRSPGTNPSVGQSPPAKRVPRRLEAAPQSEPATDMNARELTLAVSRIYEQM